MSLADRDYYRESWKKISSNNGSGPRPPVNSSNIWKKILVIVIVIIAVLHTFNVRPGNLSSWLFSIFIEDAKNLPTTKVPQLHPITDAFISEQPLPENGSCKMFYTQESYVAPFTVTTDPNNHYIIKLVDSSQNPVLFLFAKANSTVSFKAPLGSYELRWVCGEKWYGYDHLFGNSSEYKTALKPLEFLEYRTASGKKILGQTVKFNKNINGNLPSTQISSSQF